MVWGQFHFEFVAVAVAATSAAAFRCLCSILVRCVYIVRLLVFADVGLKKLSFGCIFTLHLVHRHLHRHHHQSWS